MNDEPNLDCELSPLHDGKWRVKLYHLTKEVKYIPENWEYYKLYTSLDEILDKMRNE